MCDVFISYKSNDPKLGNNDGIVAFELCNALEEAGIKCWIAPRNIEPGKRYGQAIMSGLENCKAMVVVFSRFANNSEHIANEVERAFARKIDIIPFNIDGAKPNSEFNYYLCRMQWINASNNYRNKFTELINALQRKLGNAHNIHTSQASSVTTYEALETSNSISFDVNGVSFNMVYVESGSFIMGATPEQGNDAEEDERPTHKVTISSFYIGETLVTQELWQAVMGNNPSLFKGDRNRPVEDFSWSACQKFISRLNDLTGKSFRLPTEAEWEYAARGGIYSLGYKFAGSNDINEVGWHEGNSGGETHPVKRKRPNELGLYDMCGNVWELCQDKYSRYTNESQVNPSGPYGILKPRVYRGGACRNKAINCRISKRRIWKPTYLYDYQGIRLAL